MSQVKSAIASAGGDGLSKDAQDATTRGGPGAAASVGAADCVRQCLDRAAAAIAGLSSADIWLAADLIVEVAAAGGRIYLIGNGGSAATASHMANDLNKWAAVPDGPRFRAYSLADNVPLITAWSNDLDYAETFARQLSSLMDETDLLVAISTSGMSPNILRAVQTARHIGARTLGLTGDRGGELRHLVDHCLCVPAPDIGIQESIHLLLEHAIAIAIRDRLGGA